MTESEKVLKTIRSILIREWPNTSPSKADRVANRLFNAINENNQNLPDGHRYADVHLDVE